MDAALQSAARFSESIEGLDLILNTACNLAVWQRQPLGGMTELAESKVEEIRFTEQLEMLGPRLAREMDSAEYGDPAARDALVHDIQQLATRFCSLFDLTELDLRLAVVTTDSCRKFHADYVYARLITSYAGPGTQWLEADDVERIERGLEPCRINELKPGDVGIFKGKLGTSNAAIHRSPPIEGTGERRLLLVLNPPTGI